MNNKCKSVYLANFNFSRKHIYAIVYIYYIHRAIMCFTLHALNLVR